MLKIHLVLNIANMSIIHPIVYFVIMLQNQLRALIVGDAINALIAIVALVINAVKV